MTTIRSGQNAWSSTSPSPRIRRAPAGAAGCATNHYIHNHVGSFAAAGEAFAKALVLGGVTQRFPTLHFAFLEGGVTWAADLYAGLVGHCGKRHRHVIDRYDPQHIDLEQLADLFGDVRGHDGQGPA